MSKNLKIFTILLSVILVFNLTNNFTDASTISTSDKIAKLEKQIKELKATNRQKDKQINQLKTQINNSNSYIDVLVNHDLSLFNRGISSQITSEMTKLSGNNSEPVDITIQVYDLYFPHIWDFVNDQQIKERVINAVESNYRLNVKVKSVSINLLNRKLVIPIDTAS